MSDSRPQSAAVCGGETCPIAEETDRGNDDPEWRGEKALKDEGNDRKEEEKGGREMDREEGNGQLVANR